MQYRFLRDEFGDKQRPQSRRWDCACTHPGTWFLTGLFYSHSPMESHICSTPNCFDQKAFQKTVSSPPSINCQCYGPLLSSSMKSGGSFSFLFRLPSWTALGTQLCSNSYYRERWKNIKYRPYQTWANSSHVSRLGVYSIAKRPYWHHSTSPTLTRIYITLLKAEIHA